MEPLQDVRILAIEQYGAGPFGSMQLADLGADVIKIENPQSHGDVGRYIPPFQSGEDSLFFQCLNRNKRSIDLDLANSAGRRVLEQLVVCSDALYSNLRGDVPARLRIRYEDLREYNPAIVCCSLSAFGMTGPRRSEPGYDYLMQAMTGWMSLTGDPDGPPTKSGLSLVDWSGGLAAAMALLAGLHAARRDGHGMDCDVSLFDVAVSMLTYPATWAWTAQLHPQRTRNSAHPSLVPFQNFRTSDGWIAVCCAKEKFWQRLTEVINHPGLAQDPRFNDFAARSANAAVLLELLERKFAGRPSDYWLSRLGAVGVPSGPVKDLTEVLDDPHVSARGMVVEVDHPAFGTVRQPAGAVKVGKQRRTHRRAPSRAQDQQSVLSDLLGLTDAEIRQLRFAGAFGSTGLDLG